MYFLTQHNVYIKTFRDFENVQLQNPRYHPAKVGTPKVKNGRKKFLENHPSTSMRVATTKANISQRCGTEIKVYNSGNKVIPKGIHQIISPWKKTRIKDSCTKFFKKMCEKLGVS